MMNYLYVQITQKDFSAPENVEIDTNSGKSKAWAVSGQKQTMVWSVWLVIFGKDQYQKILNKRQKKIKLYATQHTKNPIK